MIHPKARIIAEAGPIVIGEGNLIEEQALIINGSVPGGAPHFRGHDTPGPPARLVHCGCPWKPEWGPEGVFGIPRLFPDWVWGEWVFSEIPSSSLILSA